MRYYYLKDHLGSIRMTVDANGNPVGWDDYYPYGMQMTGRSYTSSADQRYKFTGKELDAPDGLYYFGRRYYDSWRAQWGQVDPMSDKYPGWSPYVYCHNNPLRLIDPNGMEDGGPGFFAWLKNFFTCNSFNKTNPGTEVNRTIVEETKITNKKIGEFPRKTVKATEKYADATSDASTKVSIAGVAAAPLTAGVSLEGSADALVIGTISDGVSFGAKTIDAIAYGGSKDAAVKQFEKLGVDVFGGKVIDAVAGKVVIKTGLNTAYRSTANGRFVSNAYGYFIEGLNIGAKILLGAGF